MRAAWLTIQQYHESPWQLSARDYDEWIDLVAASTPRTHRDFLLARGVHFIHACRHTLAEALQDVEQRIAART